MQGKKSIRRGFLFVGVAGFIYMQFAFVLAVMESYLHSMGDLNYLVMYLVFFFEYKERRNWAFLEY